MVQVRRLVASYPLSWLRSVYVKWRRCQYAAVLFFRIMIKCIFGKIQLMIERRDISRIRRNYLMGSEF